MLPRTFDDQNCSIARALECSATAGRCSSCARSFLGRPPLRRTSSATSASRRNVLTDRLQPPRRRGPARAHADREAPSPTSTCRRPRAVTSTRSSRRCCSWGDEPRRAGGRPAARPGAHDLRPRRAPAAALQPLRRADRSRRAPVAPGPRRAARSRSPTACSHGSDQAAGESHGHVTVTKASAATHAISTAVAVHASAAHHWPLA